MNKIEYLTVVDKNNNIIDKATRDEIHKNNLYHRAAHIIILYKNHVFLQLRATNKDQFPNKWDVSAAGHVLYQEDYNTAIIRETYEELNIKISNNLFTITDLPANKNNGFEFLRLFYYKLDNLPELQLELDEITTGGWFHINHVNKWVETRPDDFAGGFISIWQEFLNYI